MKHFALHSLCSLLSRIAFIAFVSVFAFVTSRAQISSRGTEFYLAFLPNYHQYTNTTTDSLYLYVVAEKACTGSISLVNRSGISRTVNFNITNPAQIYSTSLNWNDYELAGYNRPNTGALDNNSDNEKASKQSIVIRSSENVSVYALSKADKTSDASMILPTSCLGTEYRVLSYKSDGELSRGTATSGYTPSEFCVVATQANTTIDIHTTCPTTLSTSQSIHAVLQAGQSFLVQSNFSAQNLNYDLSGSSIKADKPIAVFSGHQRARIPVEIAEMFSRDCLYEQLLPTSVWGTKYVLTPLAQPIGETTRGSDLYRIVALSDNTVVKLNDLTLTTLQANGVYEAPLSSAGLLSSSKPIMVALYKKTANDNGGSTSDGDPFMMIIPPRRQYLNNYRFTNVQVNKVYHQQFVTLIVSMNDVPSLKLDGASVKANFSSVGTSCYAYANLVMTDGAHSISGASPFGLYVYGYGAADSYGYVGGMAFYPDSPDIHLDAGDDQVICPGSAAILSAQHVGGAIHWTPKTGLKCDTCRSIVVAPQKTTSYIVSGVDSSGCTSADTVVVIVPNIETHFSLGSLNNEDSVEAVVGSAFNAAVYARSTQWDTASIIALNATVSYDPALLRYVGHTASGDALPGGWTYSVRDTTINSELAQLIISAKGDSALSRDGILFLPQFITMLDSELTVSASLKVSVVSRDLNCTTTNTDGVFVQLVGCAINLRRIQISTDSTKLFTIAPQPIAGADMQIRFSLAFADQTTVELYSTRGERLRTLLSSTLQAGEHHLPLSLNDLANGSYAIVFRSNGHVQTRMVIVNR